MWERIPEILHSRKSRDVALVLVVIVSGALSFGLGRLSSPQAATASVALCDVAPNSDALQAKNVSNEAIVGKVEPSAGASQATQVPQHDSGQGSYVGSKNGTTYHLPWCSGAKRMKEENKVWFATKADAEAAGYHAAANCKGI